MNLWETNDEFDYSFELLCAGLDFKQHTTRLESNRIVLSLKMKPEPVNIDAYCNDLEASTRLINPKYMN